MDTSLMTIGLPEFNVTPISNADTISVSADVVNTACDNLNNYAASLDSFIRDIEDQKEEILRDWEGAAADQFRITFPKMIEALQAVPVSIRSISGWTMSTKKAFENIDQRTAEAINSIK